MKRSPFHQPKPVLIFNGAYILVGITRSIRSASEISKTNAQAISFACTGRYISAGSFISDIFIRTLRLKLQIWIR